MQKILETIDCEIFCQEDIKGRGLDKIAIVTGEFFSVIPKFW